MLSRLAKGMLLAFLVLSLTMCGSAGQTAFLKNETVAKEQNTFATVSLSTFTYFSVCVNTSSMRPYVTASSALM